MIFRLAMPKIKLSLVSLTGIFFLTIFCVYYFSSQSCVKESINKQRFRLIVLVLSAPENAEQRDTIRKTWLSQKQSEVKSLFPIGMINLRPEQKVTIESENQKHNDLLLLPKLYDSYGTITKKVLQSFTHVFDNYSFDFLLKCDDDSYAMVEQILKELNRWQNKGTRKELYWGYFNGRARVKRSGPWRELDWILCDYYLPYALGGGYVLSYNLVKFISENANILKLQNSEDVSVGLWVAPIANIERKHDSRFDTEYRSRGCSNQYIITHKQSIQDMKKMHEHYVKSGNICEQEVSNYLGYQYNWTVLPSQCCDRRPGIF